MPAGDNAIDWRAALQIGLLLLALPAQYLIMNYSSNTPHQSQKALKELVANAQKFGSELFSVESWQKWCVRVVRSWRAYKENKWARGGPVSKNNKRGESAAFEVWRYADPKGHYATSTYVRTPRPSDVQYRVGQTIIHNIWGYRGVIVGWDQYANAPEDWIKQNHPSGKEKWRHQPNYAILVDSRDRPNAQITYVPQENIKVAPKTKILHPAIDEYFDDYDGSRYITRPGVKELYPDD